MTITSSTYGRNDGTTCTGSHAPYSSGFPCIIDSTNWVRQHCENKQTCSICPYDIGVDPCENYFKYLTVWYTCSDIDECVSNPCQHGGVCTDGINGYTCTCDSGYAGVNCEDNIDECASNPCQHGGICTDGLNGYICTCDSGYTGNNCEENFDECGSNPCQHGGTCTDLINGYTCSCYPAYQGTDCAERNDLFDVKYILVEHESTHFSIKALLVLSQLNCARMCTLNNDCYGFEYDVIDHTCQMISAISTIAFGKVHYYVKQF
ncbi:Hypothetical predicted protein [Mytilus galloprovincialis]|uniref:EGF-like domain-containing protein n=1 Tax=Mytilus galloprovincialis TaxID=29158 RepID=A0A8B6CWW1_MYTGA|nr:Hypothetical predicted protein [Mytilus galloprovincialis]